MRASVVPLYMLFFNSAGYYISSWHRFSTVHSILTDARQKKAPEEIFGSLDFTVFIKDYSMIVATRPEPTVLPPSRFNGMVFYVANLDKMRLFYPTLLLKSADFCENQKF